MDKIKKKEGREEENERYVRNCRCERIRNFRLKRKSNDTSRGCFRTEDFEALPLYHQEHQQEALKQ